MQIGYIRSEKKPNKMLRMLAKMCAYYGNELVYFRPGDINYESKTIHGQILIDNQWETREVPIPPYIDINPPCLKKKKVASFLKKYSTLSLNKNLGTKEEVNQKIVEEGTFKDLIIPYILSDGFESFDRFLSKHKKVILKPKNGIQGKRIYMVERDKRKFIVTSGNDEERLSKRQLKMFYNRNIKEGNYLIQKYVHSRTLAGDPFDVRVRLEKNGKGEWKVVIYLVRIGTSQKVVSNVAQGGSVNLLKPFLEANFPEQADNLRKEIKRFGKEIPKKIEEIFNQDLIALGLDLAIEPDGSIYMFEVETNPGRTFGEGEIALTKADYYDYVAKKLSKERVTKKTS